MICFSRSFTQVVVCVGYLLITGERFHKLRLGLIYHGAFTFASNSHPFYTSGQAGLLRYVSHSAADAWQQSRHFVEFRLMTNRF